VAKSHSSAPGILFIHRESSDVKRELNFLTIDDSRLTKKMIRERNPEWSVARDVDQRCERRLKKNFFYII